MAKIKTQDLIGPALDWAVDFAQGGQEAENGWAPLEVFKAIRVAGGLRYSTDPAQGQPILEREGVSLEAPNCERGWVACIGMNYEHEGPTMLIAGLRCFVASELGDEVEVPDELNGE